MREKTRVKVLQNTPLGVLIGFTSAMALAMIFDTDVAAESKKQYAYLGTVILSFVGAGFTVFGVLANIANQNETARISRERKLLSARALLPIALQDVSDVAEAAARYSAAGRDHPIRPPPDLRLPERSLSVIRDLIELTDDIRVSQRLIGLLTEHQIYVEDWRRNLMGAGEGRPPEISAITAQWVFLRAVAQSIMPYARLCCTNPLRDSSRESSVVAGLHEQTYTPCLQDQELARI